MPTGHVEFQGAHLLDLTAKKFIGSRYILKPTGWHLTISIVVPGIRAGYFCFGIWDARSKETAQQPL